MYVCIYVDDRFNSRKVNTTDILSERLNNYHPKTKLTIELNPNKFLDTRLICVNGTCNTLVNSKSTKLPIPWSSKRYKRNTSLLEIFNLQWMRKNSLVYRQVYLIKINLLF